MRWFILGLSCFLFCRCAFAAPWAGSYVLQGNKGTVTLTLRDTQFGIEGTLSGGGTSTKLEGDSAGNDTIEGLFIGSNDEPTGDFRLKKIGDSVQVEFLEDDVVKNRLVFKPAAATTAPGAQVRPNPALTQPRNKVSRPSAVGAPRSGASKPSRPAAQGARRQTPGAVRQPQGGPKPGGASWKDYTHPIGLKFRYPGNWKVSEDNGILYVLPPDGKRDQFGLTEGYMVAGQPAPGITSPQDPRVVEHLDTELRQMAPFLQRVGEVKQAQAANSSGIMAVWEGTNPRGQLLQARVYATIFQGHAVAVIALGFKNQIAAREGIVKTMFASLGAGAGKRDARLVGRWKFWSYKASADGKFGTEKTRYFSFRPDGNCTWSSQSESSGSASGRDSLGNELFRGGMAGTSNSGDAGKWSADNGRLYVLWNDGDSSMWHYRLGGSAGSRRLFLKGTGAEDEWVEIR